MFRGSHGIMEMTAEVLQSVEGFKIRQNIQIRGMYLEAAALIKVLGVKLQPRRTRHTTCAH